MKKGQQEVEAEEGEVVPETSQEIPKHQQVELEQAKVCNDTCKKTLNILIRSPQQLNDQSQTTNATRRESGAAVHKLPNPPPFPPSILANGQCFLSCYHSIYYMY